MVLPLEIHPQGQLPGAIPSIFRLLRSAENAEGRRVVDLGRRRSEVCMVQHVRKRRLEPDVHSFRHVEDFGKAHADRFSPRPLQNPYTGIAEAAGTRRSGSKCSRIKVPRPRLALVQALRHLIGAKKSTAVHDIRVGLVRGRTDARR